MLDDYIIIIWASLISFVSAFLISLIKLILRLKFSASKRQVEGVGQGRARTIGSAVFHY